MAKKKLSKILNEGSSICKANGIKQARGTFFRIKGDKICSACVLGQLYIGKFGLDKAVKLANSDRQVVMKINRVFPTLLKVYSPEKFKKSFSKHVGANVDESTLGNNLMRLNDESHQSVENLIKALKNLNL